MMDPQVSVLVVEDEALLPCAIAGHLQNVGVRVPEASNAECALRRLEENSEIKVLFREIDMPGEMAGIKLSRTAQGRWRRWC